MTTLPRTIACSLPDRRCGRGHTQPRYGRPAEPRPVAPAGRLPRVSRLLALALRFDQLIRAGVVGMRLSPL
jgi:hypothetical protein